MEEASEWNTLSWGLGTFQKCVITPCVKSLNEQSFSRDSEGHFYLMNGQKCLIGCYITPPPTQSPSATFSPSSSQHNTSSTPQVKGTADDTSSTVEAFCAEFEKNLKYLSYHYQLFHENRIVHEQVSSLHLCVQQQSQSQQVYGQRSNTNGGGVSYQNAHLQRVMGEDGKAVGIFVWAVAAIQISHVYTQSQSSSQDRDSKDTRDGVPPLTLVQTLSIDMNENRQQKLQSISNLGAHMSAHSQQQLDAEERAIRMLLDVNRFRPTRIPHREIKLCVRIHEPIDVHNHTSFKELSSVRSELGVSQYVCLLQLEVHNKSATKAIVVTDLCIQTQFTKTLKDLADIDSARYGSTHSHTHPHSHPRHSHEQSNTHDSSRHEQASQLQLPDDNESLVSSTLINASALSSTGYMYSHTHDNAANQYEELVAKMIRIEPLFANTHSLLPTEENEDPSSSVCVRIEPEESFNFVYKLQLLTVDGAQCIVNYFKTPYKLQYMYPESEAPTCNDDTDKRALAPQAPSASTSAPSRTHSYTHTDAQLSLLESAVSDICTQFANNAVNEDDNDPNGDDNGDNDAPSTANATRSRKLLYAHSGSLLWSIGCESLGKNVHSTIFGSEETTDTTGASPNPGSNVSTNRRGLCLLDAADAKNVALRQQERLANHEEGELPSSSSTSFECSMSTTVRVLPRAFTNIIGGSSSGYGDGDLATIALDDVNLEVPADADIDLNLDGHAPFTASAGEEFVLEITVNNLRSAPLKDLFVCEEEQAHDQNRFVVVWYLVLHSYALTYVSCYFCSDANHKNSYILIDKSVYINYIPGFGSHTARLRVLPQTRSRVLHISGLSIKEQQPVSNRKNAPVEAGRQRLHRLLHEVVVCVR
jgi:hypothetical protein